MIYVWKVKEFTVRTGKGSGNTMLLLIAKFLWLFFIVSFMCSCMLSGLMLIITVTMLSDINGDLEVPTDLANIRNVSTWKWCVPIYSVYLALRVTTLTYEFWKKAGNNR